MMEVVTDAAQLLPELNSGTTAFVLGAGFSKSVSSSFPLTDELGERIRQRLVALRPDLGTRMPPAEFSGGRFEEWVSYLSERQPHLDEIENLEAQALLVLVTQEICTMLSETQLLTLENDAPSWFYEFLSTLHVLRARVLSLNYDNLIECGVQSLGLQAADWLGPTPVNEDDLLEGLPLTGFPPPPPPVDQTYGPLVPMIRSRPGPADTFRLMKLHGSLSWYWLPRGGGSSTLRRWYLPGTFGQPYEDDAALRSRLLPRHEQFVVPPAALKGGRLRDPVAQEFWHRAAQALAQASRVVLIGYSVPSADHSFSGMLSAGFGARGVAVEVVDPYPDAVLARLERLGVPRDAIEVIDGLDCVARWTAAEVKRLAIRATEGLRNDADLTGEELMFADGPRVDRFRSVETPEDPSKPLILRVNSRNVQLTKPAMFADLAPFLGAARECAIEVDGRLLPIIDHWVRDVPSGAPIAQLHIVPAGR